MARVEVLEDIQAEGSCSSLQGHPDNVNATAISPDDKLLASASDDGTVMLWGMENRNLEVTLSGISLSLVPSALLEDFLSKTIAIFHPDGRRMSVGR
jgi:WD40 repeat protein